MGWIDIATAAPAYVVRRALDPVAQARCSRSWETLMRTWHPDVVPLLDCGPGGNCEWFEAWDTESRPRVWRGPEANRVASAYARWRVVAEIAPRNAAIVDLGGRAAALPSALHGEAGPVEARAASPSRRRSPPAPARFWVALCDRPLTATLLALLADVGRPGSRVWSLGAPPGSGLTTWWRTMARELRRQGYTPLHASLIDWWASLSGDALEGSAAAPLVIWHERARWQVRDRHALAGALIRIGSLARGSAVVLDVVRQGRPVPADLVLSPIDEQALAASVRPLDRTVRGDDFLLRVARESGGLPGPFVRAVAARLGPQDEGPAPTIVHEDPSPFGESSGPEALSPVARANRLARRGRWSAGLRHLRRHTSALTRRGEATLATRLAHEEIRLAERTGSPVALRRAWLSASRTLATTPSCPEALELVVALGRAWISDARLSAAEGLLGTAVSSAVIRGDRGCEAEARARLAECLCWQARWLDAEAAIQGVVSIDASRWRVWSLLGRGELPTAMRVASLLLERDLPPSGRPPALLARAWCDAVVGARERVRSASQEASAVIGLEAAPPDRIEAAVGWLEVLVKAGVDGAPPSILRPARLAAGREWPRLLRCRARLALALLRRPRGLARQRLEDQVRRFALESGAAALRPDARTPWPWPDYRKTPMLNDLVHVLEACQRTDTPGDALAGVSRLVRERTRAASVVVLGVAAGDDLKALAACGQAPAVTVGRRAVDLRLPVRPEASPQGVELACPVSYGGHVLGAIACRWSPSDEPADETMALVETVATALAPTLRLAIDVLVARPTTPADETEELIGASEQIRLVRRQIDAAAQAPFAVLIEGESGSGKELVARAIHRTSTRRSRAFCALNCAALGDDLVEAELFGHARGAFTGAVVERAGLFEEAHGGTLFLDEVSELSARAQAKLLRALQEGEIRRLGESRPRRVDVRVIAATNRPLCQLVDAGSFRVDLRYRLDVIRIEVPPLRGRPEDVPLLVRHYWRRAAARVGSRAGLSPEVCAALVRHSWPGNVRELQNVLACLAVTAPRAGRIGPASLPAALQTMPESETLPLDEARRRFEAGYVRAALARAGGHRARAAASLGLTRQGLSKLMDRLGVAAGT